MPAALRRERMPDRLNAALGDRYTADRELGRGGMASVWLACDHRFDRRLALGTPSYMSPEQATAQPVDARTDQYSLASVLHEMLAGEPPFTGPNPHAIVARRLSEPARPVRSVRPAAEAGSAVLRALERIPADRFPDVATFVDHLTGHTTTRRRRPRPTASGAAVLLLAALAFGDAIRLFAAAVERDSTYRR